MTVLAVCGLSKAFGDRTAVDSLSFEVFDGEIVCLVGPARSGKTSALRMIAGGLTADSGSVFVHGKRLSPGETSPEIAFCAGKLEALPGLTCAEQMLVAANMIGLSHKVAANRAKGLLHELALEQCHDRRVESIGANERQRLEIAMKLLAEPSILLLDEPCLPTIDPTSQELLRDCLRELSSHLSLLVTAQNADSLLIHRAICIADSSIEPLVRDTPADSTVIECGAIVH